MFIVHEGGKKLKILSTFSCFIHHCPKGVVWFGLRHNQDKIWLINVSHVLNKDRQNPANK